MNLPPKVEMLLAVLAIAMVIGEAKKIEFLANGKVFCPILILLPSCGDSFFQIGKV